MTISIPESHIDLIAGPYSVILTTVMPGGQPQANTYRLMYGFASGATGDSDEDAATAELVVFPMITGSTGYDRIYE